MDNEKIKCEDCLVTKKETALAIAESILFENYGADKIKSERPYIVSIKNDSIWNIKGTFNNGGFGGVFEIEISSRNGEVVKMIHGK